MIKNFRFCIFLNDIFYNSTHFGHRGKMKKRDDFIEPLSLWGKGMSINLIDFGKYQKTKQPITLMKLSFFPLQKYFPALK